jgi:hypothetical protein
MVKTAIFRLPTPTQPEYGPFSGRFERLWGHFRYFSEFFAIRRNKMRIFCRFAAIAGLFAA